MAPISKLEMVPAGVCIVGLTIKNFKHAMQLECVLIVGRVHHYSEEFTVAGWRQFCRS